MEARVAQLWFWEGFFARSGINLQRHYHPEPLQVTDLDLLAYDFSPTLTRTKIIGEVKTSQRDKPLDRSIWLGGLIRLVDAEHGELTTRSVPSLRARDVARSLGVTAQSIADMERREDVARIAEYGEVGSQGLQGMRAIELVHKICGRDPELERAFWFLRSEVWFLDPIAACKRTIGLLGQISLRWVPGLESDEEAALRWLFAEGVTAFSLNVVTVAGYSVTLDPEAFGALISQRLSEGVVPLHAMKQLGSQIDKYVVGLLTAANAPASLKVDAMGALEPTPPPYVGPLIELCHRLRAAALEARRLPRHVDVLMHERLTNTREPDPKVTLRLGLGSGGETARVRRAVSAFLRSQVGLPDPVDKALSSDVSTDVTSVDRSIDQSPAISGSVKSPPVQAALIDVDNHDIGD
jgi:hypothetical protein